jgi:hypothetical protein
MKNFFSLSKGRLVVTTGIGIGNYTTRETGKFQVRQHSRVTDFESLIAASLFFHPIDEEASLWDITASPVMIESKFFVATN